MTVIKGQATITYRIVCPNFGEVGHVTHVQDSPTLAKAKLRAESNDRLYERLAKGANRQGLYRYYRSEVGWRVESRTTTEWEAT